MALNKILSGLVESFSEKNSISVSDESKKYEHLVNYLVISKFHPDAFSDIQDLNKIDVDSGSTFGIDAIAFIINENLVINKADIETYSKSKNLDVKILFIQTKTEEKYDSGSVLKTIEASKNFFGNRKLLTENENLKNAYEIYDELCEFKNSKFFTARSIECLIYYVTAAKPCNEKLIFDMCETQKDIIKATIGEIKNSNIFILGSDYVIDSYNEIENRIDVALNFKYNLSLDRIDKVNQSYLGYLSGDDYLKVITDQQGNIRRRLFCENVRDFQGNDNSVNTEIASTIQNKELRDKFILLNNGITIVAKHFKSLGSNYYEMRDFQIVNGCQTSNIIYLNQPASKEILVPIKIIHTTDIELISMIVKATNRQTPVPKEAFIALERYHRLLQEIFETYSKEMPLQIFYERRSGEFQFLEKSLLQHQVVNLHSMIRGITSVYFKEAYVVHNNNPANILRNRSDKLFNEDHKLEIYYISNYLLAMFIELQNKTIFTRSDYSFKYYIVMVARSLLAKSNEIKQFNSNHIENEAKVIIAALKKNDQFIQDIFIKAKEIVVASFDEFIRTNNVDKRVVLRDPKFNRLVDDKTSSFLSGN